MAILKNLGIKNLRSLKASSNSPIAPITILVGKNSAGKSTFARIFPLIRQSVERKKKSPILWYGDYVDFGSLQQSITRKENHLRFSFEIELDKNDITPERSENFLLHNPSKKIHNITSAVVELTLYSTNENNIFQNPANLKIISEDYSFEIDFSEIVKIKINDEDLQIPNNHKIFRRQGDILPNVFFGRLESDSDGGTDSFYRVTSNPWSDRVTIVTKEHLHGNVKTITARAIANQIPLASVLEIRRSLFKIDTPSSWNISQYQTEHQLQFSKRLQTSIIAGLFPDIIDRLDASLKKYFSQIRYLKPLRATAERYYRRQDLAVHEIDAEGRNLPVFLDSLTSANLTRFRNWTKENIKMDVFPKREGEQIMIMAKFMGDSEHFNITDMGFGISQVLPIAAQLWALSSNNRDFGQASAVVIEQPELHLYPEYQARLADVFAAVINTEKAQPTSLIIETHSQHIVNRLGYLVEQKVISPDDVSILLFEPSIEEHGFSKISTANFNLEGVLQNWPYGFFEPGESNVA